jgi:hypothetical protein
MFSVDSDLSVGRNRRLHVFLNLPVVLKFQQEKFPWILQSVSSSPVTMLPFLCVLLLPHFLVYPIAYRRWPFCYYVSDKAAEATFSSSFRFVSLLTSLTTLLWEVSYWLQISPLDVICCFTRVTTVQCWAEQPCQTAPLSCAVGLPSCALHVYQEENSAGDEALLGYRPH